MAQNFIQWPRKPKFGHHSENHQKCSIFRFVQHHHLSYFTPFLYPYLSNNPFLSHSYHHHLFFILAAVASLKTTHHTQKVSIYERSLCVSHKSLKCDSEMRGRIVEREEGNWKANKPPTHQSKHLDQVPFGVGLNWFMREVATRQRYPRPNHLNVIERVRLIGQVPSTFVTPPPPNLYSRVVSPRGGL